jgi:hypothetical protein
MVFSTVPLTRITIAFEYTYQCLGFNRRQRQRSAAVQSTLVYGCPNDIYNYVTDSESE